MLEEPETIFDWVDDDGDKAALKISGEHLYIEINGEAAVIVNQEAAEHIATHLLWSP